MNNVEYVNGHKIRCYDYGDHEHAMDRYTVLYVDRENLVEGKYPGRGMNAFPLHPLGIGMYCEARVGPHLGKRIAFADLPDQCRQVVEHDLQPSRIVQLICSLGV